MGFKTFNFSREITSQIEAMGYENPTPIQAQAIPVIMEGKDVMGLAQTGTGKTAAFVLPLLERLLVKRSTRIRALIIAPTRELVEQINNEIRKLGKNTGIRSLPIYGGVNHFKQVMGLRRGVDILVACPGRLLDHIEQRNINLSGLETLILDEADYMFDMGFLPGIKKILSNLPTNRQTLMFSATMPLDIQRLANEILRNPEKIELNHTEPLDTISHVMFPVEHHLKTNLLVEILRGTDTKSVIVFTRTKHRAENLGEKLQRSGFDAVALQGNLSQKQRQIALDGFRNGSYKIMVATDIAARGIDVSKISHVINYDIPDTTEAYTHRTGRTGRATCTGEAFSLVTREDHHFINTLERKIGTKIQSRTINGFDYNRTRKPGDPDQARRKPFARRFSSYR